MFFSIKVKSFFHLISLRSSRKIHSARYLGIDTFQKWTEHDRIKLSLRTGNLEAELRRIKYKFTKLGCMELEKSEMANFIRFSHKREMPTIYNMVKLYVTHPMADEKVKNKLATNCAQLCYIRQDLNHSRITGKPEPINET